MSVHVPNSPAMHAYKFLTHDMCTEEPAYFLVHLHPKKITTTRANNDSFELFDI